MTQKKRLQKQHELGCFAEYEWSLTDTELTDKWIEIVSVLLLYLVY